MRVRDICALTRLARTVERAEPVFHAASHVVIAAALVLPQCAHAQGVGGIGSGVTDLLKMVANLVVFEWGYYLGIILLAFQGYRWKTGRCDLMELGRWAFGIILVFFAPNIVTEFRGRAGGI
ncbi:TrbC/VirB2 family protein [Cupriavidus respiraculi]|uniref:Uncharacterized protein n=1 Tax=Cupriavidus respiraculi TaxID=195930 RepID=A0ABN7ZE78_9BURK|nr:TrbC/VirB2 family protein [Cupriavidus respiraculi]MBY4949535.1 TrbC/VirB2 family protein [Cupriavidus respiraculi]CAG9183979.1 hypothetical protein LMG21510_04993 [Cupriavidus respiraculi]